jgi:hypothetical protein
LLRSSASAAADASNWRFPSSNFRDRSSPTTANQASEGNRTVFHRYRPETIGMLRICLGGCPDDMEVEVKPGVPLVAKTVADLRALNAWSPNWALIVPYERQRPESVVEVELA